VLAFFLLCAFIFLLSAFFFFRPSYSLHSSKERQTETNHCFHKKTMVG
jgi:hypothetical protein